VTPEFDELRKQIDADPARRANVEEHKAEMLGELHLCRWLRRPRRWLPSRTRRLLDALNVASPE
jgi:hypothetical protein